MAASKNSNDWFSSQVSLKMHILPFLLCVVLVLSYSGEVSASSADQVNIISEIERVFKNHKEAGRVVEYLNLSKNEILQALAKIQTGTDKSFTFFAPTDWSIFSKLPQDIFDPFYKDAQLRESVLLRHFVKGTLTKNDLLKSRKLLMVDQKPRILVANATTGTAELSRSNIDLTPIPLGSNLGVVYIVDGIFVQHGEISDAIQRHPARNPFERFPFLPEPPKSDVQNVECQAVASLLSLLESLFFGWSD